MQDRQQLRHTFDQKALLYHQARPGYPEQLFEDIISFSNLPDDGRILEIGCGTGQATLPFARRGYQIDCIELGAQLAEIAHHNLQAYSQVKIQVASFEDWPLPEQAFDLVFSATAFHWIDPTIGYKKSAAILKNSGTLALFWHVHVQSKASQGFFDQAQEIYQREAPELTKKFRPLAWPNDVPTPRRQEIEQTGLFGEVTIKRYTWDITYDAESYIRLLSTYSDHIAQESSTRQRLFEALTDLINTRYHGSITKGYMALLYMAHKK